METFGLDGHSRGQMPRGSGIQSVGRSGDASHRKENEGEGKKEGIEEEEEEEEGRVEIWQKGDKRETSPINLNLAWTDATLLPSCGMDEAMEWRMMGMRG